MPAYPSNIPVGTMPDGSSVADNMAATADRQEQMRQRLKRFQQTSVPGSGAWSVGEFGDALPPKTY
jgi:hypothetical protein